MDTIEQGQRLIPLGPTKNVVRKRRRNTEAANLLHDILALVTKYNARVSRMSLTERASNQLSVLHLSQALSGHLTIVHHDSSTWASTASPSFRSNPSRVAPAIYSRPFNPMSKAELREYARKKGIEPRVLWSRFPPSDAEERAQMERELSRTPKSRLILDPLEKTIRAAARKRKANPNDPAFRAQIAAEQAALDAIIGDLL